MSYNIYLRRTQPTTVFDLNCSNAVGYGCRLENLTGHTGEECLPVLEDVIGVLRKTLGDTREYLHVLQELAEACRRHPDAVFQVEC